jgi:hypothetical protein
VREDTRAKEYASVLRELRNEKEGIVMNRSVSKLFAIGLLGTAPLLVAACAAPPTDMSMIESQVKTDLAQVGINGVDVGSLSLKQLQEIKLVTGGAGDRQNQQQQINAIIGRAPGSQSG